MSLCTPSSAYVPHFYPHTFTHARGLVRSNVRGSYNPNYHKSFSHSQGTGGSGVDIYIVDTGIYCEHSDFVSKAIGSCNYGADFVDGKLAV